MADVKTERLSRQLKAQAESILEKSGVELAYEVLERSGLAYKRVTPQYSMDRSEEYWTGWALAYYQWETAQPFAEIVQYIPIQDILAMYDPYHEMDIRQFCDAMNERLRKAKPETNLKLLRQRCGRSSSMSSVKRTSTRRRPSILFRCLPP